MYTKQIAALAGLVAFIDQAAAMNIHRRAHELAKKDEAIVWETVVQTVYVADDAPVAQATDFADADNVVNVAMPTQALQLAQAPAQEASQPDPPAAAAAAP
ncbi:hypothetical protein E4U41_005076, partial [Claviceps citrina]